MAREAVENVDSGDIVRSFPHRRLAMAQEYTYLKKNIYYDECVRKIDNWELGVGSSRKVR
jgi:hypothetical protein